MMIDRTVAHYQILEKIGEGGMGVVYRARDTRLERDVALKFLSLDFTGSEELKKRFLQEAQAASALDHPNICTIHAIEETDDGRLFISMGYYEGETVKTKLRRGALAWPEIVDLAMQIAAGLQAAHERGIIHMDVKPANLMVTPEGTVKILDFGLSKFTTEVDHTRPRGPLMGTIAYMSPERVQGEETGPESDIWALGVVLYEMATGARPFRGKNDMSLLYSIVHREAPSPLEKVPALPEELDHVIRRSLIKDRRHRYRDARELLADLEPLQQSSQIVTAPMGWAPWTITRDSRRRNVLRGVAWTAALGVLMLALFLWWRLETPPPVRETVDVVLLEIENYTVAGDSDWVGTALRELLVLELPERGKLRWLAEERAEHDTEVGFDPERGLPEVMLAQLRQNLSAEWVVDGSYRMIDDAGAATLELDFLLQDTRSGDGIGLPPLTGRTDELVELASELASRLAEGLGCETLDHSIESAPVLPSHPEANRLLHEAVEKLRRFDAPAAEDLLRRAIEIERRPNALLHGYLADALWMLGLEDEARAEVAVAAVAARRLPRRVQIYVRSLSFERQAKRGRAAALLRALWVRDDDPVEDLPTRVDLGLRLAELLARSFQEEAAVRTLAAVRELAPEDPRIPLIEGLIARHGGSRQREQEAFARAAELARRHGAPLLLARALLLEAQAWQWQGAMAETEALLDESRDIYRAHGHLRGEADTLLIYGNLYLDRQDLQAARQMFEAAARHLGAIGSRRLQSRTLANLGETLSDNGDLGAAIKIFREALEILRQLDDRVAQQVILKMLAEDLTELGRFDEAESNYRAAIEILKSVPEPGNESDTRSSYGWFLTLRGDLGAAERQLQEALKIQSTTGEELNRAWTIFRLARVLHHQGNLAAALDGYEEAMEIFRQDGSKRLVAMVQATRAETSMSQGDLDEAERDLRDALRIEEELINPLPAAKARLSLAALLLERGDAAKARSLAEEVLTNLAQSPVLEVSRAHVLRARALLAEGELDAAQQAIDQARQILGDLESPIYRLPLELTATRIAAARGDEVHEDLQSLLATVAAGVFTQWSLEIQLALGEIELDSGQSGVNRLRKLGEEAERKGYGLIAEHARRRLAERQISMAP